MIKLENTLKENMRRFATKNLQEQQAQPESEFSAIYKEKYPQYAKMNDRQIQKSLEISAQDRMKKLQDAGKSVSGNTGNGSATYKLDGVTYELSYDPKKYYPSKWINKGDKDKRMILYMQFIAKVDVLENNL
jgi:hypothetical protein